MKVFLIFKQQDLGMFTVVKVMSDAVKAQQFCKDENDIHQPEFDSWGYCGGTFHFYTEMEVE